MKEKGKKRKGEEEEEEEEKTNKRMRCWSLSPVDLIERIDGMGVVVEVRTSARQKCLHYMT